MDTDLHFNDLDCDDFLGPLDSEEVLNYTQFEKINLLNNKDYNLNSALTIDEVQEFTKYINNKSYNKRWSLSNWKDRYNCFKSNFDYVSPVNFHSWLALCNESLEPSFKHINKILTLTIEDSKKTYNVLDSFFNGWLHKIIDNPKTNLPPEGVRKWGALMMSTHILVLYLNASTIQEVQELSKKFPLMEPPISFNQGFRYYSKTFGEVRICKDFLAFIKHRRILDRTMFLMMKDIYTSRFHSLLSMFDRYDTKFQHDDWRKLNKLYKLGDRLIAKLGNPAYKGIKLLEPICNARLCDLAHEYRPLIVKYTDFQEYVYNKVKDFGDGSDQLLEIYNLVHTESNIDLVLTYHGSFRHWGHPFVNALDGLKKLHDRTTEKLKVDPEYARLLASDLSYKVLKDQFKKKSKWMVDKTLVTPDNKLYEFIQNETWPTPKVIKDFGDNWESLPLIKCFAVPDMVDPSQIYSDKSYSMNLDEVLDYVQTGSSKPLPTRKVLNTMIHTPNTNWAEFLQDINDNGLPRNDKVIGLKEKERELNEYGRFFSLMSWRLREYFVITEYLIKLHFLPLFTGITMADDLNTLMKKLLDNSSGQGLGNYEFVTYANHIDYEKWNSKQRGEANNPVFKVMGQFLGYPKLIERTHEFFYDCVFYYNQRPDLMTVVNGELENRTDKIVTWKHQLGGQEGIRQKGWSVVSALAIERESKDRNTKVNLLAQGDNQIICCNYRLQNYRTEGELKLNLERIKINNDLIMKNITKGVTKLGLVINRDETMQSADFLSYGKIPIFRGIIRSLETKRWSRCAMSTNDQMPSIGNVISTVGSNALTVSHHSDSPINAIIHYNFVGNLIRIILDIHNPAMRCSTSKHFPTLTIDQEYSYKIGSLYLDPCLGGASGLSLTRFLIRNFPDPVTESFSFWKLIHDNSDSKIIKNLSITYGKVPIAKYTLENFTKLLENPLSLNLKSPISAKTAIKNKIRESLYEEGKSIQNELIRDAILYSRDESEILSNFLMSIKPLFPRFLSEFKSATFLGITESIIGLFENSKTIRNVFRHKMGKELDLIIINSEKQSIKSLMKDDWIQLDLQIWDCSSHLSDDKREESWGEKVYGATVPHPIELLETCKVNLGSCKLCHIDPDSADYLVTLAPKGLIDYTDNRGPYMAYLGSKTSESTSIIHPWEKETKIPLIKRASKLRDAIHWFIEPDSKLAISIFSILEGLTGEKWLKSIVGYHRTGSSLHRFICVRQSNGGFTAISPSKLMRMITTTDTLNSKNEINHDFMYQSLIILSQISVSELHDNNPKPGIYHHHIKCKHCIRPIEEITLESDVLFIHKDVSYILEHWKPKETKWYIEKPIPFIKRGNWSYISDFEKSYHLGRIQGFLYCDNLFTKTTYTEKTSLFPLCLAAKLRPGSYLEGLLDGIIRASCIKSLYNYSTFKMCRPKDPCCGAVVHCLENISSDAAMVNLWRHPNFILELNKTPHRIPASYPLNNRDLGAVGYYYLKRLFKRYILDFSGFTSRYPNIWIFSDVNQLKIIGLILLSSDITPMMIQETLNKKKLDKLRTLKNQISLIRDDDICINLETFSNYHLLLRSDSEVRHAAKDMTPLEVDEQPPPDLWFQFYKGKICYCTVNYTSLPLINVPKLTIPKLQNPTISGLRLFQCATGSHYKLSTLVQSLEIQYTDAAVLGDGSGGMGSFLLRYNKECKLIFNSLVELEDVNLKGSSPSGPAAIEFIPEIKSRCVNLRDCWKHPSDLCIESTWKYILELKEKFNLKLNLIVMDMEVRDTNQEDKIIKNLSTYVCSLLLINCTLIVKTYVSRIYNDDNKLLSTVGNLFDSVELVWTDVTSSNSSEIYVVMRDLSENQIQLKPQLSECKSFFLSTPVFRSDTQEFDRARDILFKDMFQGVPKHYIGDDFVDLNTLLLTLNVESGTSVLISNLINKRTNKIRSFDIMYSIVILVINNIFRLTHGFKIAPGPLSDTRVKDCVCLVSGFLLFLSISTNNLRLYKLVVKRLQNVFIFSWMYKRNLEINVWFLKISFLGKYANYHQKNFYYDSNMARIGQVIRVFTKIFKNDIAPPKKKTIDTILSSFDQSLSLEYFQNFCDLFQLLSADYNKDFVLTSLNEIEPVESIESAFVD